jgi:peptide chain release factor 2
MQGEPDFWTNQDKAQKTIQAQKTLNALLKPYEEVSSAINDINALAELSEEDPSLEPELTGEVDRAVNLFDKFELMAMMSGKQDSANAIVSLKPGAGGTDACDFAEILYRMYGRWAQRHGFDVEEQDLEPNLEAGIQSVTF